MTLGWRRTITGGAIALFVCAWGLAVSAAGQAATPPAAGPPMAETVFKNIQVLKGIPVDEFMDAMGMFSASLGYDCASCHANGISSDRALFAVSTPAIQKARQMVLMMNGINRANFAGQSRVTCFTCHRGNYRPETVPNLALQYSELVDDPNAMVLVPTRGAIAEPVFTKYLQSLGGADAVARLTSYVATGTYGGFNTGGNDVPIQIFAKAPAQRVSVVRTLDGDGVKTFDGSNGWVAESWRPLPLLPLTGGNLVGARLDALVAFPANLQKAFSEWKASSTTIGDRTVEVVQGSNKDELPVNFYFDEAGLLVRQVRWNRTAVGTVPTQVDYEDYRVVAGVKIPFKTTITWTDGQNIITLNDVRPNVAIDPARFARPAPFRKS